jgi:hypothetical protein
MPCGKNTQVAGTLIPQDKEGNGRIISHEENVNFIFEESRTLHSYQLVTEERTLWANSNYLLEKSLFNQFVIDFLLRR